MNDARMTFILRWILVSKYTWEASLPGRNEKLIVAETSPGHWRFKCPTRHVQGVTLLNVDAAKRSAEQWAILHIPAVTRKAMTELFASVNRTSKTYMKYAPYLENKADGD